MFIIVEDAWNPDSSNTALSMLLLTLTRGVHKGTWASLPQLPQPHDNNNNNNNNHDDIYSAVIMTRSLREFTRFI